MPGSTPNPISGRPRPHGHWGHRRSRQRQSDQGAGWSAHLRPRRGLGSGSARPREHSGLGVPSVRLSQPLPFVFTVAVGFVFQNAVPPLWDWRAGLLSPASMCHGGIWLGFAQDKLNDMQTHELSQSHTTGSGSATAPGDGRFLTKSSLPCKCPLNLPLTDEHAVQPNCFKGHLSACPLSVKVGLSPSGGTAVPPAGRASWEPVLQLPVAGPQDTGSVASLWGQCNAKGAQVAAGLGVSIRASGATGSQVCEGQCCAWPSVCAVQLASDLRGQRLRGERRGCSSSHCDPWGPGGGRRKGAPSGRRVGWGGWAGRTWGLVGRE